MENTATNNDITDKSKSITYPIPRLKDNFKFIYKTYKLLGNHVKLKIDIHPAGECLLDNFYIIEECYKTIISEMTIKKYKEFPSISNGEYLGFSRIYALASEIVENKPPMIECSSHAYARL